MKNNHFKYHDLKFTFLKCKFNIICDEDIYSQDEIQKITNIINTGTKEINIDKSYVNYENTPYQTTFIKETGWKDLCTLLLKTDFAEKCTATQHAIILESYRLIIIEYAYHLLTLYNYDLESIYIDLKDKSSFMSSVVIDDSNYVLEYPGKWQTWKNKIVKKNHK